MHIDNYSEKFETETGRLIFVPNHKCCRLGKAVHKALLRKWSIPAYFFHFRLGGHVAAVKAHLRNTLFVHMDLYRFYYSVSRTKIHRTLRKFGYPQSSALKIAQWSTVRQDASINQYYSLPFGFIQSSILASVVLDNSLLGKATRGLLATGIKVSLYMDDFILSGNDEETLRLAMRELEVVAACSNFRFNPSKSIGPAATISAFNLEFAHADLRISNARMVEFAAAIAIGKPPQIQGILGYVGTVNAAQRKELEALV